MISKNETTFTENAITWLEHEADKLDDVKLTFTSFDSDEEQEMGNGDNDDDKVFKSCKRSKFYDLAKDIEKSIKQNMETEDTSVYYSLPFLEYIINHMIGLAPLRTNLLLGDIGRHGTSIIYRNWTAKYDKQQCIINATKTQGFIEKHHQSLKHIFLDEKNARIDLVIPQLYRSKKVLHRQYAIQCTRLSQRTPKRSRNVVKKKRNCLEVHRKLSK